MPIYAIFCTADVPVTVLEAFVRCNEEYLRKAYYFWKDDDLLDTIAFVSSEDPDELKTSTRPMKAFASPFVGKTIQEIYDWFDAKIIQREPEIPTLITCCFIILDARSLEDDTCLFVSTQNDIPQSIRCDFYVPYDCAIQCTEKQNIEDGIIGRFLRSGRLMTGDGLQMALNGGLYIEGGEVRVDEEWKTFLKD